MKLPLSCWLSSLLAHGLAARVEGADALITSNIFRLGRRRFDSLPGLYGWNGPCPYALFRSTTSSKTSQSYYYFVLLAQGDDSVELERLREAAKADLAA